MAYSSVCVCVCECLSRCWETSNEFPFAKIAQFVCKNVWHNFMAEFWFSSWHTLLTVRDRHRERERYREADRHSYLYVYVMWQAASGVFNAQNISQARITYAPCGPQLAAGHIHSHNTQAQFRQVD